MRIIIIGNKGQLGQDLALSAQNRGWETLGADLPFIDVTDPTSVEKFFHDAGSAQAVINAAAYTAVDAAESNQALAFAVNRDGVENLARVCAQREIPLIHVSTDYVFDGIKTSPYLPTDPINPTGVYGKSKAEGEMALRQNLARHVIVRTSWLFGLYGPNFVKTMIRLAKEQELLRVVDDQVGCPTYAGDLANALLDIAAHVLEHDDGWGTYHFCNELAVTWYAFTRRIVAMAKAYERFRVSEVIPILTIHYPVPAPRPPYSVLDCESLEARFNIRRRSWELALKEMLSAMYGEKRS